MNTELLAKVEERIRTRPETYNQNDFFFYDTDRDEAPDWGDGRHVATFLAKVEKNKWKCGAAACVAGHAVALSGRAAEFVKHDGYIDWETAGAEALDIDRELAEWLFSPSRDPRSMPAVLRVLVEHPEDWTWVALSQADEFGDPE